jgi:hypothetical protein
MKRHKHLKRLERLKDAIFKRYGKRGVLNKSDLPDEASWLIWKGLLKDIKECGLSTVFKIDGVRLYYYNELWKMVNGKDHEPLDTVYTSKFENRTTMHYERLDTEEQDQGQWNWTGYVYENYIDEKKNKG